MTTPNIRLLSAETRPLTKALVAEHLNLPASPTDREHNETRIEFLADRLGKGLFHPPYWVQAIVGQRKMRANGYHSATMLHRADGAFPEGLHVHLDIFECATMEDLASLFRQFDDRRSSRTPSDVAGAYQGLRSELADVPRALGKLGVEGIAWWRSTVRKDRDVQSGDDRYEIFNEPAQHTFLQWLGDVFTVEVPREMAKPPVIGAMYATYQSDKDAADSFWKEVAAGGREYEEEWPTTTLAGWLQRIRNKEFEVRPKGHYQGCIYAWNAMRDGKTALTTIRSEIKKSFYRVS